MMPQFPQFPQLPNDPEYYKAEAELRRERMRKGLSTTRGVSVLGELVAGLLHLVYFLVGKPAMWLWRKVRRRSTAPKGGDPKLIR